MYNLFIENTLDHYENKGYFKMLNRTLGKSKLEVSAVGMGCWAIGGPWDWLEKDGSKSPTGLSQVDDAESIRAIHYALEGAEPPRPLTQEPLQEPPLLGIDRRQHQRGEHPFDMFGIERPLRGFVRMLRDDDRVERDPAARTAQRGPAGEQSGAHT